MNREEDMMIAKMNERYARSSTGNNNSDKQKKKKEKNKDSFYDLNRNYSDEEFDLYF